MWKFAHPEYLFALLLPAGLGLVFALASKAKRRLWTRIGSVELLSAMMQHHSPQLEARRVGIALAGISLLVLALANPQWGKKSETVMQRSLDVVLALDISLSMLAEDVPPNRLARAKQFAGDLALALRSERMGVVLLAGNAYPYIPLTTDFAAVEMALQSAHPGLAPSTGTAIGESIRAADRLFGSQSAAAKVLVIISDGETHDQDAEIQAKAAAKNGMIIFTIGVGTEAGGFIPLNVAGRSDYKRDERGEPVRTRLEEQTLSNIARWGNGQYHYLGNVGYEVAIRRIRSHIDTLEKQETERRQFDQFRSFYQFFLSAGLLLLIWAYRKQ
ncbi:MAG: VWA domain-containing protein [Saprospiraceae bacterium]|nr:VWA domain-containing protein [Saprospiraceae bacterium]